MYVDKGSLQVNQSDFRQCGQMEMEKQRWEEFEKRNSQKKEDTGARKGRKVAKHHVFSWQAHYFRCMDWKIRKTRWPEGASSALNFPF